ncbi:MAG: hypothetical protein LUE31_12170 [Lachnospiraceae bacterium]|nr:hypothetical protein [Lachnospiraceae bacterium]
MCSTCTCNFRNKNKEYIGYLNYANTGADSGTGSVYVVTLPDRALGGSSGMAGTYTVSDIAYARVYINYAYTNIAFFGLLDDGYLTTMDTTSFANGGYTDVWNSLRDTDNNQWNDLGGAKSSGTYYLGSAENTELSATIGTGYFQNAVAVDGGDVLMITGNTTTSNINRSLVFLDSSGSVITNTGSDGSTSYYRTVTCGTLVAAPTDAAWVLVNYNSSYDGSGGSLQNGGLYILGDTTVRSSYNSWRSSYVTSAAVTNQILNTGNGGASSTGTATYELLTEYISVEAGDVYLLANNSPNRTGYVAMYSGDAKTFVKYAPTTNRLYNYIVIPEGVDYIRIDNDAWSASAAQDQSLLNGLTYNTEGSYVINILYCGNVSGVYETKLTGSEMLGGGSSDEVYANIRVKLSDNDTDYLTADGEDGTYQLLVYKYTWSDGDDEVSDETLLAQTPEVLATGTIHAIASEDGESWSSEVINRCRTIAVQKGYSYKVVLQVDVGEREDVELGSIYFTVRGSSGDSTVYPVYGISGRYQVTAIRSDNTGDYVLNRSLTYTSDMPTYAGTLYGMLDLQGHTLTQSYLGYLFSQIGSAAKTGAVIKNGTIAFESTRGSGDSMARLCDTNYGTLQNIQFKVNNENPYTLNGSTKVYDNTMWGSQYNTRIIYNNRGTIENFTVEYEADLVGCNYVGFIWLNYGTVQNGYLYGDGKVLGGQYVGGLVGYNQSSGTVSGIYSTIDVWGNSEALGGYITKGAYMGTIVGLNSGTVKGVLATGNVYTYTATPDGSNYTFGNERVYKSRGCAVGYTNSKMDTTECYYATVGTNKRNDYSSTSRNERVESGILLDSSWWIDLFGEDKLDDELEALLGDAWYPWVDMGNAAEKYSIRQPYLTLDVTSSASFDLVKAEVQEYTYQADGSAYATVKFTFINSSDYIVTNIAIEGLDCTVDSSSIQKTDESESGFYEITGTVQVSDGGDYVTGYNVSMVYYRRSANAGVNYTLYGGQLRIQQRLACGGRLLLLPAE